MMLSPITRYLRRALIAACLLALLPLAWRVQEVASELALERRAAALYARGYSLRLAGRLREARAVFTQVIILAPYEVEAYGSLADAALRLGDVDSAIATYRRVLTIYPYTYFASLYRDVGFIELRAGRLPEARQDLTQAITLDRSDWHAYYLLGHAHKGLNDPVAARLAFLRVLELRPDYEPAVRQLRMIGGS